MYISENIDTLVRYYARELLKEYQRGAGFDKHLLRTRHDLRVQQIRDACLWDTGFDIWWGQKNGRMLYGTWKVCEPHQQMHAPTKAYWRRFEFLEGLYAIEEAWRAHLAGWKK